MIPFPSDMQFVEKLSNSISNSNSFDVQEVILLGDYNVNLLDRKNKLIHKKGYSFSNEDTGYVKKKGNVAKISFG